MQRITHQVVRDVIGAQCNQKAGLDIGTTTTKVKSANSVEYSINGKIESKAAADPLGTPSGDDQGSDSKALYLFSLDSSGNVTCTQSAIVASGEDVHWPSLPADEAPIGGIKVETDSTTTFSPGSTDLNASGVTTNYYDLQLVPAVAE